MICEICKKRNANVIFTDSTMSYVHGFVHEICRQCFVEKIEKHIGDCQKQLKEQKELLLEEKNE